ncbi:peptidase M22 glycoprotease [Lactifluus volemus]|nr:peptidase M22 glycoprotease [Lactifluus volemus]
MWWPLVPRVPALIKIRRFTVLAIESSADDTCAAVVASSGEILSNVVVKQNDVHEPFGGIHPYWAVQAHQQNLPSAVQRALKEARVPATNLDGIAFTRGPGMPGCLGVGSTAAKTLAAALQKPLVGVHHMQAHALTPVFTSTPNPPRFPFLTLLVSGGHTLLLLATSITQFRILATTRDESIGRVFDKVARILAIPWSPRVPEPLLRNLLPLHLFEMTCFSFSGLHSVVDRFVTARGGADALDLATKCALASAFQSAAVKQLEDKVALALGWCRKREVGVQHLVVSGGVASNMFLRDRLRASVADASPQDPISLVFPPPDLCTDNAVMIGWASMHRFLARDTDDYSILTRPKWCIQDL